MNSEDSTDEHYEMTLDSDLSAVLFEPMSGVMGLKWADTTYTTAVNVLLACGMWLFEKLFDHFRWQLYAWKRQGLGIE